MSGTATNTHGAPCWIEHRGNDGVAIRAFYETVLDWTIAELPMKDGSTYYGIMIGEKPVGGFSSLPSEQGCWTAFVTADDVEARFQRAVDAGATALQPPVSVPGVGRMAVFADPSGAQLALITFESPA